MNLVRIFNGVVNALGDKPWEDGFDLTPRGLPRSFIAVAAYIPLGLIAARAAVKYNDNTATMPYGPILMTLGLIALTFPLMAYVLCMLFDKMDRFRPWVIVRNWAVLFAYAIIAAALGLYLLGVLPFFPAYVIALTLYITTLAIDVRLAWRVGGFDWVGAVFAGILISAATMMVLSFVISQNIA